jgi:hypothetical protein
MRRSRPRRYDPLPCYEPVGGNVIHGWPAFAELAAGCRILAVDGPEIAPWAVLVDHLREGVGRHGVTVRVVDARDGMAAWEKIVAATASAELVDDPDFEVLAACSLSDLFEHPVQVDLCTDGLTLVFGPGAALSRHDTLWYFDLPKRYAEAAVTSGAGRNLGQRGASDNPTTRRLFYVDWPIQDRHRDQIASMVSLWIDAQDDERPTGLDAPTLAATTAQLAGQPFRTRPTFNTTTWGGHWGQQQLGVGIDQPNTALGYELIAPESGVLVGASPEVAVEVPFQLIVGLHPTKILGEAVHDQFGSSFPIRFDYLDTVGGGNLSVHCHPLPDYMRDVFGWSYTQHESYYMMVAGGGSSVFLGLRQDADVGAFHGEAVDAHHGGLPFDITRHVQTFPAVAHQLYLVPAGTPHGSGIGNVVLEVSATPYLYSLRFYDWLRRDTHGRRRPVHVDHAFQNLDRGRQGRQVADDLVPVPRTVRSGPGWQEAVLGNLPEMFFDIRRLELAPEVLVDDNTAGRFHVLNVVEGAGITIRTADGMQVGLAYAETIVVPAAAGAYTVRAFGTSRVRVVKAYVR